MSDKRILHVISASVLAVLLIALFLPGEYSGRITAAVLLLPVALVCRFFIKKRPTLSINKGQVLMIMSVISVVLLMLLYLTGLEFGFVRNLYALKAKYLFGYALPIAVIIAASEYIRFVIRAQEDKASDVMSYIFCVVAEALTFGNVYYITNFNKFMDFVGITLFPAIISNLLYHYLSKRYGLYPNAVFRAVTSLYVYFIPIESAISSSLLAFAKLFIPILIYVFIDALYERKRRYALKKKSKFAVVITVLTVAVMASVIMLISNQFRFGTLIIATPSMTGELNVGDAAIFEKYDDQPIEKGQIIVFERDDSVFVHRVADIQTVNGITRYYTKGDANDDLDAGFVLHSDIVGLVDHKIPYVGYPTIWLRSLFDR